MSLKTLFRWHLWFGLISGLGMFIVGLTGALAVFAPEIDWLVIPALRASAPAGDATRLAPGAILAKVQAAYPEARVGSLQLSTRPSFAHVAALQVRKDGRNARVDAYVNPYTGAIQGDRAVTGGYFSSVYQFLRQTHVRLLLGLWGRVFVGVLGVSLVLSCITGLYIYRGWIKKMFTLRLGGGWGNRPPWAETHKFIGVWSLLFNILIGLTGAVLGIENLVNQINSKWVRPRAQLGARPPPAATQNAAEGGRGPSQPQAAMLPLDALLAKAREAFPDFTPRVITMPARPGGPLAIRGEVPSMLVAQSHVRSANGITLNSATGEVITQADGRKHTGWTRIYWMLDPLHFGYFGGMPTKVIWFVLGLTPSVLSLTGAWMWWKRRTRATKPREAGVPARSGTERGHDGRATAIRWITRATILLTLVAAYWITARGLKTWAFNARFAEFWLVKPVSIALCAFPVTALLAWLAVRTAARPGIYAVVCALFSGWYLVLTGILMP